ncbi:hypothetical protein GTG28_17995 [Vibrio sp. OCN044]|uniref:Uncharacterized protein n=1 Tax=Vibrio tetraodonis subsp. pristinus TaxID=2695891 RepID=A0A6L8LYB7_9VIBR|nr:hypothetical protein [Vibrio tetraodonis]MYM61124.1 hypothetical protein [Vibrio tetraodonis subsp. pristinus]
MANTSEITDLINQTTKLTQTVLDKVGEIDNKVDRATSVVPSAIRNMFDQTFYVDSFNGSDQNEGKTSSKPLKSFSKAIDLVPLGGTGKIVLLADMESFSGGHMPEDSVDGKYIWNKHITLDLNGHTWTIKTVAKNGWNDTSKPTVSLTTNIRVGSDGFFKLENGNVVVRYSGGHEGLPLYGHVLHNSLCVGDNSRIACYNLTIDSNVPTFSLLGLDNWAGTGFACHLGQVTLRGSGVIRRQVNGASIDDITVRMRALSRPQTWSI